VTVKLEAVVEARVDEAVTLRFPVVVRPEVLVVVELVVEALDVMKLELEPKRVVMYEDTKFETLANIVFVNIFVDVLFVFVELPLLSTVKLVFSTQFVPFHLSVELVAVPDAREPEPPVRSVEHSNF
jgi:hypothetical protein